MSLHDRFCPLRHNLVVPTVDNKAFFTLLCRPYLFFHFHNKLATSQLPNIVWLGLTNKWLWLTDNSSIVSLSLCQLRSIPISGQIPDFFILLPAKNKAKTNNLNTTETLYGMLCIYKKISPWLHIILHPLSPYLSFPIPVRCMFNVAIQRWEFIKEKNMTLKLFFSWKRSW